METSNKATLAVITYNYLDDKGETLYSGGVETWLDEFVQVATTLGHSVVLYQHGSTNWQRMWHGAEVVGLCDWNYPRKAWRYSFVVHRDIARRGIRTIVYANSFFSTAIFRRGNIFVQHGIYWDGIPVTQSWFGRIRARWKAAQVARSDLRHYLKSRLTFSVDTNFINYARAVLKDKFDPQKLVYLPNFAEPQPRNAWEPKWEKPGRTRIAFPRRFEYHRGIKLFAKVAERLLEERNDVEFLFLGHGPYDSWLRAQGWTKSDRVTIREVPHDDMASVLNSVHMVVVPTLHAEGTSFSVIEAMASGCAVTTTPVGGLCNLVIPDFNGCLVRPLEADLHAALSRQVADLSFAARLAQNGYSTVRDSFSRDRWRTRLAELLENAL